jgi:hypothetical protein
MFDFGFGKFDDLKIKKEGLIRLQTKYEIEHPNGKALLNAFKNKSR